MRTAVIKFSDLQVFKTFSAEFYVLTSKESRKKVIEIIQNNDNSLIPLSGRIDIELFKFLKNKNFIELISDLDYEYLNNNIKDFYLDSGFDKTSERQLFSNIQNEEDIEIKKQILAIAYNKELLLKLGKEKLNNLIKKEKNIKRELKEYENLLKEL